MFQTTNQVWIYLAFTKSYVSLNNQNRYYYSIISIVSHKRIDDLYIIISLSNYNRSFPKNWRYPQSSSKSLNRFSIETDRALGIHHGFAASRFGWSHLIHVPRYLVQIRANFMFHHRWMSNLNVKRCSSAILHLLWFLDIHPLLTIS